MVFIPQAQPHAQSLFLFPIVFGINNNFGLRPAGGDPGLDHLQKYFFDGLCFLEWTWPF